MNTFRLKPVDGQTVLNPDNGMRPLLPEGEVVPASIYWHHRIRDGVVAQVVETAKTSKADKAKA